MAAHEQKSIGWLEIGTVMAFVLGGLIVVWLVFRAPIGLIYRFARMVETGTLWNFTAWGDYFAYTAPKDLSASSIFMSSLPFGVVCAGLIVLVGLLMKSKVDAKHIITHLRPKRDAEFAMSPFELMNRFAPLYPHNEFFLKFPMHRYSASTGPASQPMSALELLIDSGAIAREFEKAEKDEGEIERKAGERAINRAALRRALSRPFGQENPFVGINLRNETLVRKAIEDLPWYATIILYGALARVEALHTADTKLSAAIEDSEEFFRNVWRDINAEKRKIGDRLVIGPYDYPDQVKAGATRTRKSRAAKKGEKAGEAKPEQLIILADHLAKVGDRFKTTARAKEELAKIIVKPARGVDPKRPVDVIDRILLGHGFVFGILASCLTDGKDGTLKAARSAGVLAPNVFLWLRFANRDLWRFLNYIGMQTPCPEAAGMYDHWQTELSLRTPRTKPEIGEGTVTAIVQEARKQSPDALTMRDFDQLVKTARSQTQTFNELIEQASAKINADDAVIPSAIRPA